MPAFSLAERIKLFVKNVQDRLRSTLLPESILSAFANQTLKSVEAKNGGYEATVVTIKPGALHSGSIKATDFTQPLPDTGAGFMTETIQVDDFDSFNDSIPVKQITKENVMNVSGTLAVERKKGLEQKREIDFVSNYTLAHIDNFITGGASTLNGAVSLGATTFTVASIGSATAGDIAYLGTVTTEGALRTVAVLIKSVSTNTITIETDKALFPKGGLTDNKAQFKKLSVSLPAIDTGAKVVFDIPLNIAAEATAAGQKSSEYIYDALTDLQTAVSEHDVEEEGLVIHGQDRVLKLLKKSDSPFLKLQNLMDSLKKILIKKGTIREFGDATILQNTNGMVRTVGGKKRYYITLFKKGFSINSIAWLESVDSDKIGGTAGIGYKISGIQMYGSDVFEEGSKGIAQMVVEL